MNHAAYTPEDFGRAPLMCYYETTLACDLVCDHCRASAQKEAHPDELATEQAKALIEQIASFPRKPTLVFTGGDPLKRHDLFELIDYAIAGCGLSAALTPSATPLATYEAFEKAKSVGIRRLGISLDGADAKTHDAFRGWEGSFDRTIEMLDNAATLELGVQVNTTICRRNFDQIDAMAELLADRKIAMWAAFFLIPVGRGAEQQRISAEEYEVAFAKLYQHAQNKPYHVKTTEAPHYRRYVLEQGGDPLAGPPMHGGPGGHAHGTESKGHPGGAPSGRGHRAPLGVGDGKGVMFISHTGEIYPAGFLPLQCGKFPEDSVVEVYQNHPTFQALRDPDSFGGNCGICEYRRVCGGSRARAFTVTGDPLATEPDCAYVPNPDADVIPEG
jgi:radical SAM protein